MNILFLNGGRRCELIGLFRDALERRGGGRIVASDISGMAPALYKADASALLPRTSSSEFPAALAALCKREGVSLLIPTIDPDLEALDSIRQSLASICPGLKLLLSPSRTIRLARDKRKSKELFSSLGAAVPDYADLDDPELAFPLFVKPPNGSSGVGARAVKSMEELSAALESEPGLMVEHVVEGPEFTVDVLCDFNGKALAAIPRKRLKVRAGEVTQGVVEMRKDLIELSMRLAEGFEAQGPVTIQFRMPSEGVYVAMEINARMGGGLPLSVAAGADWPGMIVDMVEGRAPNLRFGVSDGMAMSRYDSSVFFMPGFIHGEAPAAPKLSTRKSLLDGVKAFVFDLDDTLYLERDFVFSGYRAVAERVWRDHAIDIEGRLRALFESGRRGDLFTEALRASGVEVPESYMSILVEIYRSHPPRISPCLDYGAVKALREKGFMTGIVTDGWKNVQSSKIEALEIAGDFDSIVLTDALGGQEFWKPSPEPFKRVLQHLDVAPQHAVYIGDNPAKDFIGAHAAGMKAIRIVRPGAIHSKAPAISEAYAPDAMIESLSELLK